MATYTVHESTKGNTSGVTVDEKGYATYTDVRTFTAVPVGVDGTALNSTIVRQETVAANQIPGPNEQHPNNAALTVRGISVKRVSPIYWEITVNYQTKPISPGDGEETDPIDLEVKINWRTQTTDEEIDVDFNGASIQTVALEPITGVTRKFGDIVGTFKKNFLSFNPKTIRGYLHTTNADVWPPAPHGSFPVGEAFIEDITADPAIQDEVPYFEVTMVVVFREPFQTTSAQAWYERVRHQGFKVFNPSTSEQEPGTDGLGENTTTPVLLDVDGTQLPPGNQVNWLFFQKYGTTTFSSIGFF